MTNIHSTMFETIAIGGFLLTLVGIVMHCIVCSSASSGRWSPVNILKKLVHLLTLLLFEQKLSPVGILRKLIYLLMLFCFLVLVVTGFYPVVVLGELISGYWLMLHATVGGVFAACLALLAIMWAHRCRFDQSDWQRVQYIFRSQTSEKLSAESCDGLGQKITFWLIVLAALPLILSVVLSMLPLFGTEIQRILLEIHRYSALLLALAGIVHTYLVIRIHTKKLI